MTNLSFNQKSSFPPLLRLTYLLQQKTDEQLVAKAGISLSEAHLLSGLGSSPIPQRHLAVIVGQNESNISRQLAKMQKRGLVSIAKNKKDHRVRDVKATAKGLRGYKTAQKVIKRELDILNKVSTARDTKVAHAVIDSLTASLLNDLAVKRSLYK